jgi:hypothetical protein
LFDLSRPVELELEILIKDGGWFKREYAREWRRQTRETAAEGSLLSIEKQKEQRRAISMYSSSSRFHIEMVVEIKKWLTSRNG